MPSLLRPHHALYHMTGITMSVCASRNLADCFASFDSVICERGREVGAAAGPVLMRRAHRGIPARSTDQRFFAVEVS